MNYLPIMPSWLKIATWFLLLSIATIFIKKPALVFPVNINDVFLAVSFLSFCIAAYKKELHITISKKSWILTALIAFFLIIGSIITYIVFHKLTTGALIAYARIISVGIIFFELYIIARNDTSFTYKAFLALCFSSFFLPLMFYMPMPIRSFFLDPSGHRLVGLLVDPNYFASFQLVVTALLFWFTIRPTAATMGFVGKILSFVLLCFSIGSILWSGSRGGFLGLVVMLVMLIGFAVWRLPVKKSLLSVFLIFIACIGGYFVLPSYAKNSVALRIYNIQNPYYAPTKEVPFLEKVSGQQDRFALWQSSLVTIIHNPFGYGPSYHEAVNIYGEPNDPHRVAHNTLLEILLTGGIGLLLVIGIALWLIFANVSIRNSFGSLHVLIALLVGLGASSLLLDSLWTRWIWIVLALIAAVIYNSKKYSEKN